jgi:hypothetical protein
MNAAGVQIAMTSSALTRFLKQGLARHMCPLCRVAHKLEQEFMWYFFDDYSGEAWALDALRNSRGFCRRHSDYLKRIEVDGLRSTLGISETYEDTFTGLAEQLARLGPDGDIPPRQLCPACASRDEEVRKNVRYLLDTLAEDERQRERFIEGPGLCLPHFELTWADASASERRLLLDVERRSVAAVSRALTEHVRKQGHEARDEAETAEEAGSWRLAINLTAGWPAEWDDPDSSTGRSASTDPAARDAA